MIQRANLFNRYTVNIREKADEIYTIKAIFCDNNNNSVKPCTNTSTSRYTRQSS